MYLVRATPTKLQVGGRRVSLSEVTHSSSFNQKSMKRTKSVRKAVFWFLFVEHLFFNQFYYICVFQKSKMFVSYLVVLLI